MEPHALLNQPASARIDARGLKVITTEQVTTIKTWQAIPGFRRAPDGSLQYLIDGADGEKWQRLSSPLAVEALTAISMARAGAACCASRTLTGEFIHGLCLHDCSEAREVPIHRNASRHGRYDCSGRCRRERAAPLPVCDRRSRRHQASPCAGHLADRMASKVVRACRSSDRAQRADRLSIHIGRSLRREVERFAS